jgi:sugar O-acyltransferase (sialic acid O-acetyltransferase NeuD family)
MKKLLIIGTGDYAQVAVFYLKSIYDIVAYSEEAAYRKFDFKDDLPIYDFEDISKLFKVSAIEVFVAIGPNKTNSVRERLCKEVLNLGYKLIKYVHPTAYVWSEEAIGYNSFIFPNCIVEPFALVGNNCVMWSGSILAHHSSLDDNVFMAPGAKISGRTIIKKNCFIGINSTIRDNIVVEENCIIGAGAIIKKSTIKNGVYSSTGTLLYNQNSFETKV